MSFLDSLMTSGRRPSFPFCLLLKMSTMYVYNTVYSQRTNHINNIPWKVPLFFATLRYIAKKRVRMMETGKRSKSLYENQKNFGVLFLTTALKPYITLSRKQLGIVPTPTGVAPLRDHMYERLGKGSKIVVTGNYSPWTKWSLIFRKTSKSP